MNQYWRCESHACVPLSEKNISESDVNHYKLNNCRVQSARFMHMI
jgi:hypothetical protein